MGGCLRRRLGNSLELWSISNRGAIRLAGCWMYLMFWSAQLVFAAERWQQEFRPKIRGWLGAVGENEGSPRWQDTRMNMARMCFRSSPQFRLRE